MGSKCLLTTGVARCEQMFHSVITGLAPRDVSCGRNGLPGTWESHTQGQKVLGSSLLGPKVPELRAGAPSKCRDFHSKEGWAGRGRAPGLEAAAS